MVYGDHVISLTERIIASKENQAEHVAMAAQIFGRRSVEFLPLLDLNIATSERRTEQRGFKLI